MNHPKYIVFRWMAPPSLAKSLKGELVCVSHIWGTRCKTSLNLYCWVIFHRPQIFLNLTSPKIFHEHYQSVKQFGSRSGLMFICVQTVCKDHQQTTKFAAGRQRVKDIMQRNTSHGALHTFCFMHGLSICEIKRMRHCVQFFIIMMIWEF